MLSINKIKVPQTEFNEQGNEFSYILKINLTKAINNGSPNRNKIYIFQPVRKITNKQRSRTGRYERHDSPSLWHVADFRNEGPIWI